jgi:transaldolase
MSERLKALSEQGVSVWLDDLSRERLETGNLADLVKNECVVGVTTNPTIFAAALSDGERYDAQVRALAAAGTSVDEVIVELTTEDVRDACDVLAETYRATNGVDGRVSIEVAPTLAFDTDGTFAAAKMLWAKVDRPNVFIKIPATSEGMPAITAALGEGISVNVTLIFGLGRYDEVMDAYLAGLERAEQHGRALGGIHSVASFFVSRVDTEIDARLDKIGTPEALALKGKAGVANARLAYEAYERKFAEHRFHDLRGDGANTQRPLWASTGVKNPNYADTMYVAELIADNVVNTMPEKTLQAFADHGVADADTIPGTYDEARQVLSDLAAVGVGYDDVIETLEREGVEKFVKSWDELVATVQNQLDAAQGSKG